MNVQTRALLLTFVSISMVSARPTLAQNAQERSGRGYLAALKVGQWIRLDGAVQKGRSVLCSEARVLTGDFLDDDWSVQGVVGSLNPKTRSFMVGPYSIVVSEKAVFENSLNRFSDLRIGMFIEAEGSYRKDGTFLAEEVEEADDVVGGSEKYIQIVAKIERIDVAKRQITAMGTIFQLADKTRLKSVLR